MSAVIDYQLNNNVAVITVNNPPVNALSQAVRKGLVDSIDRLNQDRAAKAGIIICAGRTFIAGADISEFNKPPLDPVLPEVITKIESSNKIIVAAIHGTALGGGFETAMACHFRCASDDARVGLPEVKLGLLPGASGTQRLPRLIGIESAIEWMVSGEQISVQHALDTGAIDRLVSANLLDGTLEYVNELLNAGEGPVRLSEVKMHMDEGAQQVIKNARELVNQKWRGYFSPQKIIDCVEASLTHSYDEAVKLERSLFNECKSSSHSKALRRLFFAERQVGKVPDLPRDTPTRDIRSVAVVGAGTMGSAITVCFLNAGYSVYLTDRDEVALESGMNNIKKIYQSDVDKGRLSAEALNDRLALLSTTMDMTHLNKVDLVVESVVEDLVIKQELIKYLQSVIRPDSIIASNTSTLDINRLADVTERPENVIGMHFFAPANKMKLLEVVRSNNTADDTLATIMGLAKSLNKIGVAVKSGFGFVGNRIFLPYLREAQLMLLQGESPSRIDQVAYDWGFPMGPFSVMDLSGLDVFHNIYQQLGARPGKYACYPLCDVLFDLGRLGKKNNVGFYRYQDGEQKEDPEIIGLARQTAERYGIEQQTLKDEEIINRLILAMINEAGYILQDKIASNPGDIDVIMVNGYGFPRYRGGPLCYADSIGINAVYQAIRENERYDQNAIWAPSNLLKDMSESGMSFYEK